MVIGPVYTLDNIGFAQAISYSDYRKLLYIPIHSPCMPHPPQLPIQLGISVLCLHNIIWLTICQCGIAAQSGIIDYTVSNSTAPFFVRNFALSNRDRLSGIMASMINSLRSICLAYSLRRCQDASKRSNKAKYTSLNTSKRLCLLI